MTSRSINNGSSAVPKSVSERLRQLDQEISPPASSSSTTHPRIAIFGSVDFYHPDSPALCDVIGANLANQLPPECCLLTGANAVTQERLSRSFVSATTSLGGSSATSAAGTSTPSGTTPPANHRVFHLAPRGFPCNWDFGTTLEAGRDMEERRFLLANLATICISIEGGPGTVDEIRKATNAGNIVIPLARTGGASSGMFGAPFIHRPTDIGVDETTWALLHDETAPIEDSAQAVVSIILSSIHQSARRQRASEQQVSSEQTSLETTTETTYVEPTLAGCAHLVFQGTNHYNTLINTNNAHDSSGQVAFGDIYLGPEEAASESAKPYLDAAKIGGIVNCTNRYPNRFQSSKKYCTVAVNDEDGADILTYLPGATRFIHAMVSKGVNVLVHCQRGISRSATIVIAYLIRYGGGMTRDDAFRHVESRRPIVCPNRGFWKQLQRFEDQVKEESIIGRQEAEQPGSSPVANNSNTSGDPVAVDIDWAQKCTALFSTCHEIPEIFRSEELTKDLSKATTREAQEQMLTVCLDFVWGRGVLNVDLEWLRFVCDQIGAGDSKARTVVRDILRDEDSEFWGIWSGEVYDSQIERVLEKLAL